MCIIVEIDEVISAACRIPVATRSKVRVFGCLLAGIVGSNPAGGMDICAL